MEQRNVCPTYNRAGFRENVEKGEYYHALKFKPRTLKSFWNNVSTSSENFCCFLKM